MVNVIGAGIAGPAAALALARAGYRVTVTERRHEHELRSHGVLGITPGNRVALGRLGADITRVELDNSYTDWTPMGTTTKRWDGAYVMWTDLHSLLIDAARESGAVFRFGTRGRVHGTTVMATGIGWAGRRGLIARPAYVVHRGLSSLDPGFAWLSVSDPMRRFAFKLAHTPIGASWEMYVHRTNPVMHTVPGALPHDLPAERSLLAPDFRRVVDETRELAIAPISDWDVSGMVMSGEVFSLGDANGAMRPHTSMGANLGIMEALSLPQILQGDRARAAELLEARRFQHRRGIALGTELLGR